jgi:hypothetical protein
LFGWETGRTANKKEKGKKRKDKDGNFILSNVSSYKMEDWPGRSS